MVKKGRWQHVAAQRRDQRLALAPWAEREAARRMREARRETMRRVCEDLAGLVPLCLLLGLALAWLVQP